MSDQFLATLTGRRERLEGIVSQPGSTHAGLWFERYFLASGGEDAKRNLMRECATIGVPPVYRSHYEIRKASLPSDCLCAIAEVCGRMVIGTGDKGVAEAGVTLHHTYGVPYIPGSALKGLAATYANMRLEGFSEPEEKRIPESQDDGAAPIIKPYHTLFGAENSAGYLTFFDALYIPDNTPNDFPLAPDVITGHHSGYYVGDTPQPPADWDSPIPVPFLTATGRYLIAVAGPQEWAQTAIKIVGMALRDIGIGAKTAAGYGRMRLFDLDNQLIELPSSIDSSSQSSPVAPTGAPPQEMPQQQPDKPVVPTSFVQQLQKSNAGSLPNLMGHWESLPHDIQATAAQLMIDHACSIKIKGLEEKSWYKKLLAAIQPDNEV
jgi:CRISPR-associated protein Cmr6